MWQSRGKKDWKVVQGTWHEEYVGRGVMERYFHLLLRVFEAFGGCKKGCAAWKQSRRACAAGRSDGR